MWRKSGSIRFFLIFTMTKMPMKLFYDNKTANRTKHIEIDRYFKEKKGNGSICIPYIPSSQQTHDILTKGLLKQSFDSCISKLDLIDIYAQT